MVKKSKKKASESSRPQFDYVPVSPLQYDRYITLTCKLVSWSYLNFTIRIPLSTPLAHLKKIIVTQHQKSLSLYKVPQITAQIADFDQPFNPITPYDLEILGNAVNSEIRLYKGSPLSWPALPDDGCITLQDVGFAGSCANEPETFADVFYDFVACRIIGNGKEKV